MQSFIYQKIALYYTLLKQYIKIFVSFKSPNNSPIIIIIIIIIIRIFKQYSSFNVLFLIK